MGEESKTEAYDVELSPWINQLMAGSIVLLSIIEVCIQMKLFLLFLFFFKCCFYCSLEWAWLFSLFSRTVLRIGMADGGL